MKLQDKVLFVTGAAGGIGKAAAKVCATRSLTLTSRALIS